MANKERGQGLISKYVWLVDTIYKAGKISFKDLNQKWLDDDISCGIALPKRTFDHWREAIADLFGIDISNENCGEYCYYIENREDIDGNGLRSWLFSTFCTGNALSGCQNIKDRILLEDVPSGQKHLQTVVEAIKANRMLNITYRQFFRCDEVINFDAQPYCLKLFRQRWYLVARSTTPEYYRQGPRIYALDRILKISTTADTFKMPVGWSAHNYFKGCFGMYVEHAMGVSTVKLKVSAEKSDYIRTLPLHESQQEIERACCYSIFSYRLRITNDFMQEILSYGSDMEVLEPQSFRDMVRAKISKMAKQYEESVSETERKIMVDSSPSLKSQTKFTVRSLKNNELPMLDDFVYMACFVPEGEEPYPRSIVNDREVRAFVGDMGSQPDDHCLVAESDGEIVGAVWVRKLTDNDAKPKDVPQLAISVKPEFRGRGIGTSLMKALLAKMRQENYEKVALIVDELNFVAQKLYQKLGFVSVGVDGCDYIMVYRF